MFTYESGCFMPTDRARGPWNREFLHGGPTGALLTHLVESAREPGLFTTRIAIDLLRPVPVAPLSFDTQVVRDGRRVRYVEVSLYDGQARVARADAVMQSFDAAAAPPVAAADLPASNPAAGWEQVPIGPWLGRPDDRILYHTGIQCRLLRTPYVGQPAAAWLRVPYALLPGRPLTPIEHAGTLADCANGIGLMSRAGPLRGFINGELTIHLVRAPVSDWICMECAGFGEYAGLCTSNVNLYDGAGLFGHVGLAGMANPLPEDMPRTFPVPPEAQSGL
ncbi:MAG: acyl-CoA thioesterase domain-containing protein [Gammaproteobacteria bacterium]